MSVMSEQESGVSGFLMTHAWLHRPGSGWDV